jgi:hypothetical protein
MQAADGVQQACIRITNVRSLLTVLQCVKPPNAKQVYLLEIASCPSSSYPPSLANLRLLGAKHGKI